jgi:hypothetical protein
MSNAHHSTDETGTDEEIVTDGGCNEPADPAKALLEDAVSL